MMRVFIVAGLALAGTVGHAAVTFVYSAADPAFASLALHDDYSGVAPQGVGLPSFVSNSITYTAVTNDVGVWTGASLAAVLATTEIPNHLVTANGDENFRISPSMAVRRMGFETFTINEPGNPLSVPGAPNVSVDVATASGSTVLSLIPPLNNHGFLGIVSDEPILSVTWLGVMGRVKDTGITNMRISESVPEPVSLVGFTLGACALAARRRRRG